MAMLITFAVAIILILAAVACWLHWKLHKKRQGERERNAEHEVQRREKRRYAHNSIKVLSRAALAEQCSLTEASIRISVMLQAFPLTQDELDQHRSLLELAKATSHIPILDDWKKLSSKEKLKFDRERESIEAKYRDVIISSCERIANDDEYLARYIAVG